MVPTDASAPYSSLNRGTKVLVKADGQDDWNFKTTYNPEVEIVPGLEHNIVGIRYFDKNSLLLDFETREIGLRLGHRVPIDRTAFGPAFRQRAGFSGIVRQLWKNFALLPLPARLDSRKPRAYFSATLALSPGEC
ncbi:hypothetical protein X757_21585 [Mesorhizobium sp. LSHC414A00]|nr:hypothetical protein X757_21585 [Mesorhizobium sp. LSHC414A00]